jgi:predicted Zn-dependent peptidase
MHVLNSILGGGISSRLFRRIREEGGLVHRIGSEYHGYRDDGMLVIEGSTAPECLMEVLDLTLAELWKLTTTGESLDDELWKAKMQIRGQHIIAAEDVYTRMSRLATQEFYFGRHIPTDDILDQVKAVDGHTLRRLAADTLQDTPPGIAIAIVGPDVPQHCSKSAVEELLTGLQ